MNDLFYPSCKEVGQKKEFMPTIMRVPVPHDDGTVTVECKTLESVMNPLVGLTYDDFSISTLLKRGIAPKSIQIQKDLRLGFDAEIDEFNSYLESHADELFNINE